MWFSLVFDKGTWTNWFENHFKLVQESLTTNQDIYSIYNTDISSTITTAWSSIQMVCVPADIQQHKQAQKQNSQL
jgi:hypothetical protein